MNEGLTRFIEEDLLFGGGEMSLAEDDDLLTTGLIDSLGIMRLVVFIEETYDTKVPYEDITIENFRDVKTIVNYLQQERTSFSSLSDCGDEADRSLTFAKSRTSAPRKTAESPFFKVQTA